MHIARTRRHAFAAGFLALAAVASRDADAQARAAPVAVGGVDSQPAAWLAAQYAFAAEFSGVAGDRAPGVWTGVVAGEPGGTLTLSLASLGSAAAGAEAVWPVRTRWVVAHGDSTRSFVAELDGVVDWTSRRMRASGTIVEGWRRGAPVSAEGSMDDLDATGTLRVYPVVAGR